MSDDITEAVRRLRELHRDVERLKDADQGNVTVSIIRNVVADETDSDDSVSASTGTASARCRTARCRFSQSRRS